jgi:signal transduction histidine kinase
MSSREEISAESSSARLEALAEFAAGAGHELNNPLANISGRAQSLLRGETNSDRRRQLAAIVAQAERAHRMIVDLMIFARPPKLRREYVDLCTIVSAAVAADRSEAEARGIAIETSLPNEPIVVSADRTQLAALLSALLRNSLDAITHAGRIEVRLQCEGDTVHITVADTGTGLTEESQQHAFDPFYSGRQSGRGLGFGLCKCYRITQLHGGDISLDNRDTGGAVAIVRLPLTNSI